MLTRACSVRFGCLLQEFERMTSYAWDACARGQVVSLPSGPSQAEALHKEFLKKKEALQARRPPPLCPHLCSSRTLFHVGAFVCIDCGHFKRLLTVPRQLTSERALAEPSPTRSNRARRSAT